MNRIPSKSQLNLISVPLSVASLFVAVVQIPYRDHSALRSFPLPVDEIRAR